MYNVKRETFHHSGFHTIKTIFLEQIGMSGLTSLISLLKMMYTNYPLKKFVNYASTYQDEGQE